jgi:hypothetical protein
MTQKYESLDDWRLGFDALHGPGSAAEFESALSSRTVSFASIAARFQISKQRVSQLVHKHFPAYTRKRVGTISMKRKTP